MTGASPRTLDREISRLAVPALGALLAEPLYILADTAVVARLGTTELAAFGIAASLMATAVAPLLFLAYATTSSVARLLGAGDERGAASHAVHALWLAVGLGTVLVVGGGLAAPWLVGRFDPEPAVVDGAVLYLRIALLGAPALLLGFAGVGYLRGLQDTRTPLLIAGAAAVGNLVLELLLILGLGLGLGASAAATVVAQWCAAAVYVLTVARAVRAHGVRLRPERAQLRAVAAVSRDLFLRTVALRAAFLTITVVASRFGTVALAASEVAFSVSMFLAFALDALAIAAQAMVGMRVGAADREGTRAVVRRLLRWGLVFGVAAGALLVATHRIIASAVTDDPAVTATLAPLLLVLAAIQPIAGVVFVLDGVFIGAGDMAYLARAMAVSLLTYLPLAGAVVVLDLGVTWLWVAVAAFLVARAATLLPRVRTL